MNLTIFKNHLKNFPVAILGIPLSNLSLSDLVLECTENLSKNKQEGKTTYFTMMNNTLITQCYNWRSTSVKNIELLSILQKTNLSASSDKSIKTFCKFLGSSLCSSYTSFDILHALCQFLAENEKGIFFLGGTEKETKTLAISLHDKFNKLRLVGIAAPPVYIEGENLTNAFERDNLLIEQINASNADVLFINLGSVKQQLWIQRVRHKLFIPLILNLDKPFEKPFSSSLLPKWPQRLQSRILNNEENTSPHKKRIFWEFLQLISLGVPLFFFHHINHYLYKFLDEKKDRSVIKNYLFLSSNRSIVIMELPKCLNVNNFPILVKHFEETVNHDVLILDFRNVRHIQPEGFYLLIKTWLQRSLQNKQIYGFSPSRDIKLLMKLHGAWNLLKNDFCESAEILMCHLKCGEVINFYDTFTQSNNQVTLSLLGALDNKIDYANYIKKLVPIIGQKDCCIDFSFCTFVDNSGFTFLLNLKKYINSQQRTLTLSAVDKNLKKLFKLYLLIDQFIFKKECKKN